MLIPPEARCLTDEQDREYLVGLGLELSQNINRLSHKVRQERELGLIPMATPRLLVAYDVYHVWTVPYRNPRLFCRIV